MSWPAIDRNPSVVSPEAPPLLDEAVREKIRAFLPRYPTRRAAMLPALRIVQEALGHISWQAMLEVAALLELPPADVFDVVSFYSHFWTAPRGRKVIVLCRSLSCDLMGSRAVAEAIRRHLGIGERETTPDGRYSFMTEECLGVCEGAPCMLINERVHTNVRPEDVPRILDDPDNDRVDYPRSDLYDAPARRSPQQAAESGSAGGQAAEGTGGG